VLFDNYAFYRRTLERVTVILWQSTTPDEGRAMNERKLGEPQRTCPRSYGYISGTLLCRLLLWRALLFESFSRLPAQSSHPKVAAILYGFLDCQAPEA